MWPNNLKYLFYNIFIIIEPGFTNNFCCKFFIYILNAIISQSFSFGRIII